MKTMMKRRRSGPGPLGRIAATVGLAGLAVQPVAGAAPLQPTAKWVVDFGEAHCIAMRNYGTDAEPLMLAFKPAPIGDVMQMSVLRPSARKQTDQYPGSLTIGEAPPVKVSVLGYHGVGNKQRVNSINLDGAAFVPLRSATSVRLQTAGEIDVTFALSNMAPVTRALDRCIEDLAVRWHVGRAYELRAMPRSREPLATYFSDSDYPQVALMRKAGGSVEMTMLIDERGKVASCMVTQTSGYASLDAQSCSLIMVRAKFEPAVGLDGKPTKSGLSQGVKWMMER